MGRGTDLWDVVQTYGTWYRPMGRGTDLWDVVQTYGTWHGDAVAAVKGEGVGVPDDRVHSL